MVEDLLRYLGKAGKVRLRIHWPDGDTSTQIEDGTVVKVYITE
jgi:hypothetical protein